MQDEPEPRELRHDLGGGWTFVSSPADRDALIHLEGPYGIRATVPQEDERDAFQTLGIRTRLTHGRPGRPPKITQSRVAWAIIEEYQADPARLPTQLRVAKRLTEERDPADVVRQVARVVPNRWRAMPEPWRGWVRSVCAGWDRVRDVADAGAPPQESPTT
jgi:hypothetical protein